MVDELKKKGIFIVHALKGYEYHESRIRELFGKNGLNFEFVTDGDPSLFDRKTLEKYFTDDIEIKLSKGVLSCTLNHIFAYQKMLAQQINYALVFENDPFFLGNFVEKLQKLSNEIENLPKGFIVSLENTTLTFPAYQQTKKGKLLYQASSGRMAGAYLIDLEGATQIVNDLKINKCHTVIDWWHNSLVERGIIKMYWAHPPLVEQGSHNGYLSSTISTKPNDVARRVKWRLQKFYKMYIRRLFKEKRLL
jgi:glycosyl transferase, family 25